MNDDARPRISRVNTRGRPFPPGNPGRPKGARNRATALLESLFDGEAEEIGRKAVELAKMGRLDAIRLVLDRACPPRRSRIVEGLALPAIASMADAAAAQGAITAAAADGTLTIAEARDLAEVVEACRKAHELADLERRIEVLERRAAHGATVKAG